MSQGEWSKSDLPFSCGKENLVIGKDKCIQTNLGNKLHKCYQIAYHPAFRQCAIVLGVDNILNDFVLDCIEDWCFGTSKADAFCDAATAMADACIKKLDGTLSWRKALGCSKYAWYRVLYHDSNMRLP